MINLRHAAVLALVGWYLMIPSGAPFSEFRFPSETLEVFDSSADCKATMAVVNSIGERAVHENYSDFLAGRPNTRLTADQFDFRIRTAGSMQHAQCIASDDPRLKETK